MAVEKKVKTFAEKLADINKIIKDANSLRDEALKKNNEARKKENNVALLSYNLLCAELRSREIDPTDMKFIIKSCEFYKKYLEENKPSFVNADKDVSVKNVSDTNG